MKKINRIAVFCGASEGARPEYLAATQQLASALVAANIGLIYGGSTVGLMGALANYMLELEGEVIGVIPRLLVDKELAHPDITELHVVSSMQERKELIAKMADGFILLPGGAGSLDEFFEIFTYGQLGLHKKPCGILNVENYYDLLMRFLDHATIEGFLGAAYREMIVVEDRATQLILRFFDYQAPAVVRWDKKQEVCDF